MRKTCFVLSILLLSFCVTSCTVTQSFDFTGSSPLSGKSQSTITTDDFFNRVIEDLASWSEEYEQDSLSDSAINNFETNLINSKKAYGVSFEKQDGTYNGVFSFNNFEALLKALSGGQEQSIVKISESNGTTRLEFTINMDNYRQLTDIVPFLQDPNFAVYGPLYNNYLSEEDYLDMIAFILGEDGPQSIEDSTISIRLSTPRPITKTNAKLLGENTVEFSFPLIDFLLLHNSISFWCEF